MQLDKLEDNEKKRNIFHYQYSSHDATNQYINYVLIDRISSFFDTVHAYTDKHSE